MIEYIESVIGFDARESISNFPEAWDNQRIRQYLLKTKIIKPCSADLMVWDSIFHMLNIELPNWIGPGQQWDNLQRLQGYLKREKVDHSYWLVAVSKWSIANEENSFQKLPHVEPNSISREWDFLGFDIADPYLLSGLMNAGYLVEEHEALSEKWSGHLNQYHLFDNFNLALQFKSLTDERVEEHKPFSVYGIYLIERVDKQTMNK